MIRTDRIGDVILTLPLIDTLKYNYPDAKIDFLVNLRVLELVRDYPNINKVHAIEKDSLKLIKKICSENEYDLAVIVRPLFVVALAVFLARIKNRLGTGYRWYSFLFNMRHYQHRKFSVKHEMEYNLDLLDELDCYRIENLKPKLEVESGVIENVRNKIKEKGINKEFIIIHPGTLGSAKRWSESNFAKLINLFLSNRNFTLNIVLTGTSQDKKIMSSVLTKLENKNAVFVIEDLGLKEFAALCKLSRLFIGNSTGTIHIAAAVGAFCVGFYSPETTESANRWAPFTDRKEIFTPEINGLKSGEEIMDKINPEDVYKFIVEFVSEKR